VADPDAEDVPVPRSREVEELVERALAGAAELERLPLEGVEPYEPPA
jgi:hypothetical protein